MAMSSMVGRFPNTSSGVWASLALNSGAAATAKPPQAASMKTDRIWDRVIRNLSIPGPRSVWRRRLRILAGDQEFLNFAQARELLQLGGNIFEAQRTALAFGHAQPFDQQGKSRTVAGGHAGQIDHGRPPVVDRVNSDREQRAHRGELQRANDPRSIALQKLERR